MDLFIPDPPYGVLQIDRDKLDPVFYNLFFSSFIISNLEFQRQFKQVSQLANFVLKETGTGIIFCSDEQFGKWVKALGKEGLHVLKFSMKFVPKHPRFRRIRTPWLVNQTQSAVVFHKSSNYHLEPVVSSLSLCLILNS